MDVDANAQPVDAHVRSEAVGARDEIGEKRRRSAGNAEERGQAAKALRAQDEPPPCTPGISVGHDVVKGVGKVGWGGQEGAVCGGESGGEEVRGVDAGRGGGGGDGGADGDGLPAHECLLVKALHAKLRALPAHASEGDMPAGLGAVLEMKPKHLHHAIALLHLDELPDEVILVVGRTLLKEGVGMKQASIYMSLVLVPKLLALKQPASRALLGAVMEAGKAHPRAAQDCLILPLLAKHHLVASSQVQVMNRIPLRKQVNK
jgi:hypothetical protein